MKIYDISQEVFSCQGYPGDPMPKRCVIQSMENGALYNLTAFEMCAHNGTHVDAPRHFIKDGKAIDEIGLAAFVGRAFVAEHDGVVTGKDAEAILDAGADLITLCSMLRIPVSMHNVPEEKIFRPAVWNAFGMDKEGADYRACGVFGAQFKK